MYFSTNKNVDIYSTQTKSSVIKVNIMLTGNYCESYVEKAYSEDRMLHGV